MIAAMDLLTLIEIRRSAQNGAVLARVHVQVESAAPKLTREQQPYCELNLADACDRMTLRVWSDHPTYKACSALTAESFIELSGEFHRHSQYGLEARKWTMRPLTDQEKSELLQGPADLRARQGADWEFILQTTRTIVDPRLRALCDAFLKEWGERFRRTAAARNYHHARRGGLIEHTAQMMRVALKVASLYPALNVDLLLAGILFHDCGKLWENSLPESGFTMAYDERGELMGHISIGLELVNSLWRKLSAENANAWRDLAPASEDVRLHLLHLIGAHHGEAQFGSPVSPKTPEAMALHYIDNLDARLEMFAAGYTTAKPLAPRIFDRVRPLPANLVTPLEKFSAGESRNDGKLL
ncbi:MAG: hydrolase [Verrucomicrobia bacterium]|nr:MAG: hydrolase [Verrucomicrobiota bacterium]PYK93322.1 MAG: hydrolase [Verrucomicrobiota bacterium]PYL38148.1 MAG: hydrolase [Verrucomicrobiota bacterium]PYL58501.1 MAG: hydrolase [Verrucomicrobiota bacterium]